MAFTSLAGCLDVGSFEDDALLAAVTCPANVAAWAPGVAYRTDDVVSFVDPADAKKTVRFFRVRQPHRSQSDWSPPLVASLFEEVTCAGVKPPPAPPPPPPTTTPPTGGGNPPPTNGALAATYAPYFFAFGWNNPAFPFRGLVDLKAKTGLNGVTLAFVLARNGQCAATTDVFDNQNDVNKFVAGGGLVKASFGGAFGTYLENACTTPEALAGVLADFVTRTGITDLDFDVEQAAAETPVVNDRRARALRQLQDRTFTVNGRAVKVKISFTVPSSPTDPNGFPGGMPGAIVDVLKAVRAAGVNVTYVNLMTMDFGAFFEAGRSMGTLATLALTDANKQLQTIFGVDRARAFAMLGVTPMIGQNDTPTERFLLSDVATVTAFVKQNKVGLVSFWGINRDQPGGDIAIANGIGGAKTFDFNTAFTQGLKQ
jgi:alkanesulfonate monooxygenase SsuD/methylene tetrahydromethanopterin reductase-like flavin-dependent oxidoreductase (luciferase family)